MQSWFDNNNNNDLLWFVFVLFKLPRYVTRNSALFLSCFSYILFKNWRIFRLLAVKIIYYKHLARVFSIVFLDLFFWSSKCRPRVSSLFIPRLLRPGSELNSQCRGWICVLKLRSLSRWCVVLLVICFERQSVKGGSDNALPCAAILSSVPTRRLEKSKEHCEATELHLSEDRTVI